MRLQGLTTGAEGADREPNPSPYGAVMAAQGSTRLAVSS